MDEVRQFLVYGKKIKFVALKKKKTVALGNYLLNQ